MDTCRQAHEDPKAQQNGAEEVAAKKSIKDAGYSIQCPETMQNAVTAAPASTEPLLGAQHYMHSAPITTGSAGRSI